MFEILKLFDLQGTPCSWQKYGSGHINETYLVETDCRHRYILQKINHRIFKNVDGLMRNIELVTGHLYRKTPDSRRVLTLVRTSGGQTWVHAAHAFWRVYEFVERSICLDAPQSMEDLRQSALAFGGFQRQLSDFPADQLEETIPRFHDTPDRYRQFKEALEHDVKGRKAQLAREIDFVLAREEDASLMTGMLAKGELPLRVTHNDTKLNNVLLDAKTRTPLCVIDLDTVMPGLAGNDFGDSIRFGASTAAEDEKDLEKVHFSLPLYRAYAEGFLAACGETLTPAERETLPLAARLMTLECGVRFLTDHLNGDVYFHIAREGHNLDRCRTQFRLVSEMERLEAEMQKIIMV